MRYFDHDTTASSDSLIMHLRLTHGGAAVDAYYTILEEIYATEGPLNLSENSVETTAISYRLATEKQTFSTWLETMINIGLLAKTDGEKDDALFVTSERAEDNIRAYQEKCEKARQAGKKGGSKSRRKANAKQPLSDSQAKKRKEKKGDITSSVISPTSDGAGQKAAPPAVDETSAIFHEVDELYESMLEHRADAQRMVDEAVPCPPGINPFESVSA